MREGARPLLCELHAHTTTLFECGEMRRETSRVSFLMCPFCVRAPSSVLATHPFRTPPDATSGVTVRASGFVPESLEVPRSLMVIGLEALKRLSDWMGAGVRFRAFGA
jgi:hypothetical protein